MNGIGLAVIVMGLQMGFTKSEFLNCYFKYCIRGNDWRIFGWEDKLNGTWSLVREESRSQI